MVTLTVDEAQHDLKALAARALRGERVLIRMDESGELLALQSVSADLPPNYLAACYGPEEIAEENYLAQFSPKGTST